MLRKILAGQQLKDVIAMTQILTIALLLFKVVNARVHPAKPEQDASPIFMSCVGQLIFPILTPSKKCMVFT